ncbi:hypothetical protein SKAU_G00002080 [Synaphobranchus kaupii]|uniref:Apolipoprotein L, 1 n=1 Tax=Synaphobranchus kaupii TaxID=118154 RepID=A0A9Q1G8E7_SYNKA|nr:hypothetical protein SKAU_G00002080 [Synaphobranchus kaupii]
MEKRGRYLGLEEQEQEENRKQEKGGKITGMFRRSPKPSNRSLPEQDSLSSHSDLSASNDNLSDNNNTKEKGGMLSGMFKKPHKPSRDHSPAQENYSHGELSASNDSLSEINTKEIGGMFSGMFKKPHKTSRDPTPAQDSLSAQSELSASNDDLFDNISTKEKGGIFGGMFRKSPKPSRDPTPAQDNISTNSELSASYDSLSDISNSKEKGGGLSGIRRAPKPAEHTRPLQDSLSLHSDLSLSCEELSETSSKSGIMGKILRNPFRAVTQDKDKSEPEPEPDAGESSPPTTRRSKQNGVMNSILKNPFRTGNQDKEQDSDSDEKPTNTEPQSKHKQNAVVGAISKLNPFRSAPKEVNVEKGSAAETEVMQDFQKDKPQKQERDHKPAENPPSYENVLLQTQERDHKPAEDPPSYENVLLQTQKWEDGLPEGEVKKEREESPRVKVPKKGKKARNPFLPPKGAKGRTIIREPKSGDSSVDKSSDPTKPAEDGRKGKSSHSQLEENHMRGMQPEMAGEEEEEDLDGLMEWWNNVEQWDDVPPDDEDLTEKEEAKAFAVTANKVQKGIRVFNKLFTERAEGLWQHVIDLRTIADGIDRFNKKAKIAAITGGSTSAVGGVATIAGLALAPVTMGTSLIITAVGLGVATAGGLTSASASISNTVNNSLDRKKVEKIVEDYQSKMADISKCMKFIKQGIENLRKYDVVKMKNHAYNQDFPVLTNIYEDGAMAGKALLINAGEIMRVVQIANVAGSTAARAVQIASLATGVLTGLFVGMDIYFVAKDSRELKKGAKTEFAAKIREVSEQLHEGLVELNSIRNELQDASKNI